MGCAGSVRDRIGVVGHPGSGEICLWRADGGSACHVLDTASASRAARIDVAKSIEAYWEELVRSRSRKLIVESVDSNDAGTRVIASASMVTWMPTSSRKFVQLWFVCVLEGSPGSLECTRVVIDDERVDSPRIEAQIGACSWVTGGDRVIVLDSDGNLNEFPAPHGSLLGAHASSIRSARIASANQDRLRLMVGGYRTREPAIPNDGSRIIVEELWYIEGKKATLMDGRIMDERLDSGQVFRREPSLYITCDDDANWIVPFGLSDDGRIAYYYRRRDGLFATSALVACEQESGRETVLERFGWALYRE